MEVLPPRPQEIKPHPHGIELGRLIQMLHGTKSRTLMQFLVDDFSSIGKVTAARIIEAAGKRLSGRSYPKHIAHAQAVALHHAFDRVKIPGPRTDCIVPIGEPQLLRGLQSELAADFYTVTTRPAGTYRGNPVPGRGGDRLWPPGAGAAGPGRMPGAAGDAGRGGNGRGSAGPGR